MEIREAFFKAADAIEQHPHLFDFWENGIPGSCSTPGCASGWVGHFLGIKGSVRQVCAFILGRKPGADVLPEFLTEMARIGFAQSPAIFWHHDPIACAKVLRLYADKHFPAAPIHAPDWEALAKPAGVVVREHA